MSGSAQPEINAERAHSRNASNTWQTWLEHPERFWLRHALFQIHYWVGAVIGLYVAFMSVTGSILVHGSELAGWTFVRRIANLHENLMGGAPGRLVNGIGAICVTVLCLTGVIIWWPGLKNWRRSLTIDWRVRFARMNWDLHSALGFWLGLFVLLWGVSGIYFCFPRLFDGLYLFDPSDKFTDPSLYWLSELHFGRFNRFTEAVWTVLGLVPAVLAFTGTFICCRRVIFHKRSNPHW
jgi:PepSY-associated TM region